MAGTALGIACALLLLFIALACEARLRQQDATPKWQIRAVTKGQAPDTLAVQLEGESESRMFDLTLDKHMYSDDAVYVVEGKEHQARTKFTYSNIDKRFGEWGTITVDVFDENAYSGVFFIEGEINVFKNDAEGHRARRLNDLEAPQLNDVVVKFPDTASTSDHDFTYDKDMLQRRDPDSNAFFPGCYPLDTRSLIVKMNIAADAGFYSRVSAGASTSQDKLKAVQRAIEEIMSAIRPLYLAQLNVLLTLDKVVIGTSSSSGILGFSRSNGKCPSHPYDTLALFTTWVLSSGYAATPIWHLLTDCHPSGVVGAAYDSGLCGVFGQNTAVSSYYLDYTWVVVAHEIGHNFGAGHTYYGGRGGIMDNGSGRLNGGAVQFHPENGPQMCTVLSREVSKKCPGISYSEVEGNICGNGVLEPDEECECVTTGVKSCNACQGCKLKNGDIQCSVPSIDGFVVRHASHEKFVSVTSSDLAASPECCSNNRLVSKTCNSGRDVCSTTGTCDRVCYKYLLQPCGFDESGCIQKCWSEGRCQGRELVTQTDKTVVGAVPNGIACTTSTGKPGTCQTGYCTLLGFTRSPTSPTTRAPTIPSPTTPTTPTKSTPTTQRPSISPTFTPSEAPTLACPKAVHLVNCHSTKAAKACRKMGCTWCGGRSCQASKALCSNPSQKATLYGHCNPFSPRARPVEGQPIPPCPIPDDLAVCKLFGKKGKCINNKWIPCQWCAKQKKCVPFHPEKGCGGLVKCLKQSG